MKNELKEQKKRRPDEEVLLPDPPLIQRDVRALPQAVISASELREMMNAYDVFQIARADFEKKRANVTLKLLLCADYKSDQFEIELNQSGGLIVTDMSGIPMERIVIGPGDSGPAFIR